MPIDTAFLRRFLPFAMMALAACSTDEGDGGNPPPVDLDLELVANVASPLMLTAPAGDARLFVAERQGVVRIVSGGVLLPTPFLDISALVRTNVEQGLLGLAFDPQYATNGRFFVSYSNRDGDNVLASYTVSAGNPDIADPGSAAIRLTVPQPQGNHNGGHVTFGPDGFLYLGRGDGGGSGDPNGHGQARNDLLGSILRLDVSAATGYTVPASNPFTGETGVRGEIWSYGLRNPWRFSFDRATGDLYVADVGQNRWEEVNVVTAADGAGRGTNFGWNVMEGTHCFEPESGCNTAGLWLPQVEYGHDQGCSITGGYVYRGAAIPSLQGTYLYGDYCGGWVRSFRYVNGQVTASGNAGLSVANVLSFGEDSAGELYVLTGDAIHRIVEAAP